MDLSHFRKTAKKTLDDRCCELPHFLAKLALETERLMYKEGNGSGAALLGAIFR